MISISSASVSPARKHYRLQCRSHWTALNLAVWLWYSISSLHLSSIPLSNSGPPSNHQPSRCQTCSYDLKRRAMTPTPADVLPGSDDRVTRITQLAGVTKDPAGSSSASPPPPTLTPHQPPQAGARLLPPTYVLLGRTHTWSSCSDRPPTKSPAGRRLHCSDRNQAWTRLPLVHTSSRRSAVAAQGRMTHREHDSADHFVAYVVSFWSQMALSHSWISCLCKAA